jgi:pyroglutamyl-peptidase
VKEQPILVTGFEPYGQHPLNPSREVVERLDGTKLDHVPIVGRLLPVSFNRLRERIVDLLAQINPAAILNLGLWPGEPVIRLERIAVNLASSEIPDNEGVILSDQPIYPDGPLALASRLPIGDVLRELLRAGIPARLSNSAGTFLCNATMYTFLWETERGGKIVPCGFVHLPYLPEQVAHIIARMEETRTTELHQRADLCSMSLDLMMKAVQLALRVTVHCGESIDQFNPARG